MSLTTTQPPAQGLDKSMCYDNMIEEMELKKILFLYFH